MLETTAGALANELEAEQRCTCAVSQLKAGLTARPVPQVVALELWSQAGHQMLLLADLTTACSTTASRPAGPHRPGAGHTPSHHLHLSQIQCLCFAAMGRLCLPASAPSGPAHPCWLAGLALLSQAWAPVPPRHRCLSKAEHTRGSTCSDAFSIKAMSSLKATAMTFETDQPLTDRLRIKSWEGSGVCLTLVWLCFRWKAKPQKGKAGGGNNRTVSALLAPWVRLRYNEGQDWLLKGQGLRCTLRGRKALFVGLVFCNTGPGKLCEGPERASSGSS